MVNLKHLIHAECAKHDVSPVFVETLIARLIVARAIYHQVRRTGVYISNIPVLAGRYASIVDRYLLNAVLDVCRSSVLTKDVVQHYVAQHIWLYKHKQERRG